MYKINLCLCHFLWILFPTSNLVFSRILLFNMIPIFTLQYSDMIPLVGPLILNSIFYFFICRNFSMTTIVRSSVHVYNSMQFWNSFCKLIKCLEWKLIERGLMKREWNHLFWISSGNMNHHSFQPKEPKQTCDNFLVYAFLGIYFLPYKYIIFDFFCSDSCGFLSKCTVFSSLFEMSRVHCTLENYS